MNLHIVHHLNPKVPWYNLRPAYEGIKKKYPEFVLEYDLDWKSLHAIFQRPLAELDSKYNFFRAAPLPEDLKPQS